MIDNELPANARAAVEALNTRFHGISQIEAIQMQLNYLTDYVHGVNGGERLSEVNIGLLALREVEPREPQTARLLYAVAEEVRREVGKTGWPR